ncbi:hypothetical protein [Cellulomonas biazotea]|uniref:Uncharacterized protein n=1 Tax=Cellulomonas biazotea TaxID=1709 RepID=A0A402DPE3_9CELL|nr:hypothetical protein [Cellulomonas biazotea]GCE76022.1 hypothetical protein CBZ_10780 [Cellulomonas biazotea]
MTTDRPHTRDAHPGSDAAWREELVLALRARDVDGARIGEVLAEVDEHCRASGEDAAEAFGDPAAYAAARTVDELDPSDRSPRRSPSVRQAVAHLPSLLGLLLVVACAGRTTVPVTVGWLLAAALYPVAATLVVHVVLDAALTGRSRRGLVVAWALLTATSVAALAAVLLLPGVLVTLPRTVALVGGGTLLVAGALVATRSAVRSPDADVVSRPWDDPADVRRRNVRAGVLAAWLLPAMAVVGYAGLTALDAALPG